MRAEHTDIDTVKAAAGIDHQHLTRARLILSWPSMLFSTIQQAWQQIVQQPAGFIAGMVLGIVVGVIVSGRVNEFFRHSNRKLDMSPPKTAQAPNATEVQVPATETTASRTSTTALLITERMDIVSATVQYNFTESWPSQAPAVPDLAGNTHFWTKRPDARAAGCRWPAANRSPQWLVRSVTWPAASAAL